jgi:pimeloyl-ACP methyl ester carboxylesterase
MHKMPLILIPGLLCDALLWQPQVAALGDVADVWIPIPDQAETIEQIAAAILASAPFARFSLGGLSMGGYVAFEIMRQAPERVTRLALLDTHARADTTAQAERRQDLIALADRGRFAGVTDALLPQLIHPDRLSDPSLTAMIKTMARNIGKIGFVRQERAILARADSRALLPSIGCPSLVLCGRQDNLTPVSLHEEMAQGLTQATLEIIEQCGHLSSLEQPEAVSRALRRWLQR